MSDDTNKAIADRIIYWFLRRGATFAGIDLEKHPLKRPMDKSTRRRIRGPLIWAIIFGVIFIIAVGWMVFYLYASLGIVYYNEGQYQKAIPHLQRLVDYPFIPGTRLMLADSYIETGKYRDGAELYGKTFGAHSRDYYNYGLALYKQGKISEARAQWKFIIDCLPESDAKSAAAEALKSLSK